MERTRIGHLLFEKVSIILLGGNSESFIGDQVSFVEGIFFGMAERDKFVILLKIWEGQGRDPAHRFQGRISSPLQLLFEWPKFLLGRYFVEATNSHIDRMDCSTPKKCDNLIASLL